MFYQTATIWITLVDVQGQSSTASLSKCDCFSYSCAAVYRISTRHNASRGPFAI